jgi:lipoprotein-releasing system permease protein
MKSVTFLIARRYLAGTRSEKNISLMVMICFIGICIGSFALALITSIMNGFEKATYEKMQGIHAQITIASRGENLNIAEISKVLAEEFPSIAAVSPSALKQVIIQHQSGDDQAATTIGIMKGIDPTTEALVSVLPTKVIRPEKMPLQNLLIDDRVLIGDKLAQQLGVAVGDSITLLIAEGEQIRGNKIILNSSTVTVAGIFSIGIDEFDSNFLFSSLTLLEKIFPDAGPTQLSLKLIPSNPEQPIIQQLRDRLNLEVYSWRDLYPALVAALKLDKYVSFFVLVLITLVASMNVISLLFMLIVQKRVDVAILRAMGLSARDINHIFFIIGLGIASAACLLGLLLAFVVGTLLDRYPFITLPDAYYVTQLPVRMEWYIFVAVFIVVISLSVCATAIAIRRTKKFNIAHILRFEA